MVASVLTLIVMPVLYVMWFASEDAAASEPVPTAGLARAGVAK
jgi:hypothetical protein